MFLFEKKYILTLNLVVASWFIKSYIIYILLMLFLLIKNSP